MIWDSTLIMATIDVAIVMGAMAVFYVSFRHRETISRMRVSRSVQGVAIGSGIIAAPYLADLYVMLIMPLYTTDRAAMAAMRDIHLNWSWIAVFAGLACIVAGSVLLLAKLFPRIEAIVSNLEAEVAERKRAEAKLHEAHDELESHVARRTVELVDANRRLVREIAGRGRSEKINTRLGRIVEDSVNEIYVFDGETFRFIQVNRGARENLGYSMAELSGLTPLDIKPGFTAETFAELVRPLRNGLVDQISFDTVHQRKDGTSYDVEVRLQLARGESPPVFFAVIQDITARKHAEAALRQSEARLANAQRIANLGNWDWNIETGELHWSDQIYRIFGLEPQQFGATYEAFLDVVHPDDRGMLQAAVDRALSEGEVYAIDHRIVLPGGEERIVHEQGEVIFGASGNPLRMSGTVQDITEQKRVEREIRELNEELEQRVEARTEALRDSEEQLRLITNNVPAAIAYLNANQTYEFINKRYEEWFGISSEDAHGRRVQDVVGKAAPNSIEENLAKALSGKLVSFETSIQTGEAGIRDVLATYVPHYSDAGTVRGVFVLVTDITERKRLENELLRQERLATLGQLTATVSHELRNPLGVIRTSAYTLRKSLDTTAPYAGRALERVERSVVRCDRIIEELLDFTRISELEPAPTLLDDWLDDVLDDQVLPPGVVLRRDLGLPGTKVSFDRDRLRRAVINVFDNACQAMQGEGEGATTAGDRVLTVHTRAHADRVELVFEDRGPGIAPEICERIFEPLFSTKGFGVGLGLPVVKQIMEQQGGGIDVQTEIGRGTTVRLWLGPEVGMKGAAA